MKFVSDFWDFVDNRQAVRRSVLIFTVGMVWYSTAWAQGYAAASERTGTDVALIIGAATGPLTVLMGYVFKLYAEGRTQ